MKTDLGQVYDKLYRNRQKGDYADLVRFEVDEVSNWYSEAMTFVRAIENIIRKELDNI